MFIVKPKANGNAARKLSPDLNEDRLLCQKFVVRIPGAPRAVLDGGEHSQHGQHVVVALLVVVEGSLSVAIVVATAHHAAAVTVVAVTRLAPGPAEESLPIDVGARRRGERGKKRKMTSETARGRERDDKSFTIFTIGVEERRYIGAFSVLGKIEKELQMGDAS